MPLFLREAIRSRGGSPCVRARIVFALTDVHMMRATECGCNARLKAYPRAPAARFTPAALAFAWHFYLS